MKRRIFPIDYKNFKDRYGDLLLYLDGDIIRLEKLLLSRFTAEIHEEERAGIDERGVWIRKRCWPDMGLVGYDEPEAKREALRSLRNAEGESIKRLLSSSDLGYYNNFTPQAPQTVRDPESS